MRNPSGAPQSPVARVRRLITYLTLTCFVGCMFPVQLYAEDGEPTLQSIDEPSLSDLNLDAETNTIIDLSQPDANKILRELSTERLKLRRWAADPNGPRTNELAACLRKIGRLYLTAMLMYELETKGTMTIPPGVHVRIRHKIYCMDKHRGGPRYNEPARLRTLSSLEAGEWVSLILKQGALERRSYGSQQQLIWAVRERVDLSKLRENDREFLKRANVYDEYQSKYMGRQILSFLLRAFGAYDIYGQFAADYRQMLRRTPTEPVTEQYRSTSALPLNSYEQLAHGNQWNPVVAEQMRRIIRDAISRANTFPDENVSDAPADNEENVLRVLNTNNLPYSDTPSMIIAREAAEDTRGQQTLDNSDIENNNESIWDEVYVPTRTEEQQDSDVWRETNIVSDQYQNSDDVWLNTYPISTEDENSTATEGALPTISVTQQENDDVWQQTSTATAEERNNADQQREATPNNSAREANTTVTWPESQQHSSSSEARQVNSNPDFADPQWEDDQNAQNEFPAIARIDGNQQLNAGSISYANPRSNNRPVVISPPAYYLEPINTGVQRMAVSSQPVRGSYMAGYSAPRRVRPYEEPTEFPLPDLTNASAAMKDFLENVMYGAQDALDKTRQILKLFNLDKKADTISGLLPGISTITNTYSVITGREFWSQSEITMPQRSGRALLLLAGPLQVQYVRAVERVAPNLVNKFNMTFEALKKIDDPFVNMIFIGAGEVLKKHMRTLDEADTRLGDGNQIWRYVCVHGTERGMFEINHV